jgi:hypothetical protein
MIADKAVVGIFASVSAAEGAKAALVEAGVSTNRIALSVHLTQDSMAAEAPGQSYVHQSYRGSDTLSAFDWLRRLFGRKPATDSERARYNEAVRTGACILTVRAKPGREARRLKELLHREGARITMERPDS